MYDAPSGTRLAFPDGDVWSYTFEGNRLVVRLTRGSLGDEWVEVELGVRPNGVRGWVRAGDFNWTTVNHHVHIDVSDRTVALYDGDTLVASTRAIVGKPATPTPTLRGFISEKLPNSAQQNGSVVYGNWILFLSFYSEVLNSFGGALPVVALHGTHIPERVGEALCQRVHPSSQRHHRGHRAAGPAGHGREHHRLRADPPVSRRFGNERVCGSAIGGLGVSCFGFEVRRVEGGSRWRGVLRMSAGCWSVWAMWRCSASTARSGEPLGGTSAACMTSAARNSPTRMPSTSPALLAIIEIPQSWSLKFPTLKSAD